MSPIKPKTNLALTAATEAVANLCEDEFSKLDPRSEMEALRVAPNSGNRILAGRAQSFIDLSSPCAQRWLGCWRTYRRYFKLALAHPRDTGQDANHWALIQLQPAIHAAIDWIRDWYVLACEGENRHLVTMATVQVVPTDRHDTDPVP